MTGRLALIALTGAAAVAANTVLAAPASPRAPLLIGTTGPDPVITLKLRGKKATRLKAGTYRIRVYDRSTSHDFTLLGPRVNKKITTTRFTGAKLVTVTLRKGRYEYFCEPHLFSGMRHQFSVR